MATSATHGATGTAFKGLNSASSPSESIGRASSRASCLGKAPRANAMAQPAFKEVESRLRLLMPDATDKGFGQRTCRSATLPRGWKSRRSRGFGEIHRGCMAEASGDHLSQQSESISVGSSSSVEPLPAESPPSAAEEAQPIASLNVAPTAAHAMFPSAEAAVEEASALLEGALVDEATVIAATSALAAQGGAVAEDVAILASVLAGGVVPPATLAAGAGAALHPTGPLQVPAVPSLAESSLEEEVLDDIDDLETEEALEAAVIAEAEASAAAKAAAANPPLSSPFYTMSPGDAAAAGLVGTPEDKARAKAKAERLDLEHLSELIRRRRKSRPMRARDPDDTPLRDGNRDRLMGLITERAAKTLLYYFSETNENLYVWFNTFCKDNPIPRDGRWEEVNGDLFLAKLLSTPPVFATHPYLKTGIVIDPRNIAQRLIDVRAEVAREMAEDLDAARKMNNELLRHFLLGSLSLNFDEGSHPREAPKDAGSN